MYILTLFLSILTIETDSCGKLVLLLAFSLFYSTLCPSFQLKLWEIHRWYFVPQYVFHIYLHSKAFISPGTLSESPTYLKRLREAQNFLSDKCIAKIQKSVFNQTKPICFKTSEAPNSQQIPKHLWRLKYRHSSMHTFSSLQKIWFFYWLALFTFQNCTDMRIHKVSPCSLHLKLFFCML